MLLALDIGNTTIAGGVFDGAALVRRFRLPTDEPGDGSVLRRELGDDAGRIDRAVAACVVPHAMERLETAVRSATGQRLLRLRDTHPFPLAIEMDAPEQVGDDRLANALGAHHRANGPALVADLGTAVTIDVITLRGYAGGVIAPGMRLAARALHEATALLPLVDVDAPDRVMGKSTVAACQSGLTYGIAAMVDGLADRLRMEQEMPDAPLLVTGGHAPLLARLMRLAADVQPDLTLEGLRLWSEANG